MVQSKELYKVPFSAMNAPTHIPAQPGLDALSKSFDPVALEARWGKAWEESHLGRSGYRASGIPKAGQDAFAIQLPPPNVTGTLHMGHAFNQTVMDTLARYHRMKGDNTVWVPGTDHAGIATQIVVEGQLAKQGLTRQGLGRKNFVARIWDWKEQSGNTITQQMRRMGSSVDWDRQYFTMDDNLSKTVTQTFVQLYEQGLIYRGQRLVNWDPSLKTAVSDLEVESKEEDGFMWHIRYPLVDDNSVPTGQSIVVATTRPETLLGDSAIMVHPEDERYRAFVGQRVALPLCGRTIPVIADDYVEAAFGTGAVKVTPAHDPNDYAVGQRHKLPMHTIFTLDATVNDDAPEAYRGLDRFDARAQIVADLKAVGLLVDIKPHKLMVPRCARTNQIVEPMLTDQWFMAMDKVGLGDASGKSIAQKAIDAVADGEVRFVPDNWVNTFNQWMSSIQDWCISRQLWWGHQIPAWYDQDGNVFVAADEKAAYAQLIAQKHGVSQQVGNPDAQELLDDSLDVLAQWPQDQATAPADIQRMLAERGHVLRRDADVLDTWYSSALVPFSTMGWPEQSQKPEDDYNLYLPSSTLVTGYDIIFFWVARMIMMTKHFTGRVPFKDVYIHGLVRDAQGRKMSKSEGNVLDPVDLIDGIELPALLEKRVQGLRRPETEPDVRRETAEEFPEGIPAYGADALRMTFASLATLGRSINFDSRRCEGYRNFCNKLWNATRFVLMHCEGHDCQAPPDMNAPQYSAADRWIVSKLQTTAQDAAKNFAEYRLDNLTNTVYDFAWNEFCAWYLEVAKVQLQTGSQEQKTATRSTLIRTLDAVLRLVHPIMPFMTEELWQKVAPVAGTKDAALLGLAPYPELNCVLGNPAAEQTMAEFKALVEACRALRAEMKVPPSTKLPLYVLGAGPALTQMSPALIAMAKLSGVSTFETPEQWKDAARGAPTAVVGQATLCLHVDIDPATELARLDKERARLQAEIGKAQSKLSNEAFVAKAPAAVLDQERTRVTDFTEKLAKIQTQITALDLGLQAQDLAVLAAQTVPAEKGLGMQ